MPYLRNGSIYFVILVFSYVKKSEEHNGVKIFEKKIYSLDEKCIFIF